MVKKADKVAQYAPGGELESILMEATAGVEADLRLEDAGWQNLSGTTSEVIPASNRIANLKLSRLYATKDPLGKQAIRLWTDYTFGTGMTWSCDEDGTKKVLEAFWNNPANAKVLSAAGQRKSSNKALVDGEVFFAIFLGAEGQSKIRFIDPLEITEIITNIDDKDDVKYYKREWSDPTGKPHQDIYQDISNPKDEGEVDSTGAKVQKTQEALILHAIFNSSDQRGNPLLLPALDWIVQYRRFLASRIAIMLALARFAWKNKTLGGQARVDAIKAKTNDKEIKAGSTMLENLGSDTTPIKADTGAKGAYDDARMVRLQICAAVGVPEQYFGDISTGNLATAKTVELPMLKMFTSYQSLWLSIYKAINTVVLNHRNIAPDKQYVDMDFPAIAPEDVFMAAQAIVAILGALPEFKRSDDVKQIALLTMGINDPAAVLEFLKNLPPEEQPQLPGQAPGKETTEAALINALKGLRESLQKEK